MTKMNASIRDLLPFSDEQKKLLVRGIWERCKCADCPLYESIPGDDSVSYCTESEETRNLSGCQDCRTKALLMDAEYDGTYSVKECPRCKDIFCSTNNIENGDKHRPDFMFCPHCESEVSK